MTVPFLDLGSMHAEIEGELNDAWMNVTRTNAFIGGKYVAEFEAAYAAYCGVEHCVGVANGTDALTLTFRALGIRPGDEVIVPANTFIATAEAVVDAGAKPVFVDVDPDTLLVSAAHIEAAITSRTAAAVVVHLYGQTPDMDAITAVTRRTGILLVEDAAQAQGAMWAGRRAGSFGDAAAFSFYPGKNLGAFGDAGAVTTNDTDVAARIRAMGNHGRLPEGWHSHDLLGVNSRLDGLQAAILSVKLGHLDRWNDARRGAYDTYVKLLAESRCAPIATLPNATPVHHLAVVRVPERDPCDCRARRTRNRMGTALPGALPPAATVCSLRRHLVPCDRACRGRDSFPTDVSDDYDCHGGVRRRCTSRRHGRERAMTLDSPSNDPAPVPATPRSSPDLLALAIFQPKRTSLKPRAIIALIGYVVATMLVAAMIAYVIAGMGTSVYGARSEIYYQITNPQSTGFLRQDRTLSTQLVALTSRDVLGPVAAANGTTVDALTKKVHAKVLQDSEVIQVEVDDPSSAQAQKLAGAVVTEYLKQAQNTSAAQAVAYLKTQLTNAEKQVDTLTAQANNNPGSVGIQNDLSSARDLRNSLQTQLNTATVNQLNQPVIQQLTQPYLLSKPVAPKPLRSAIAGALIGLVIAMVGVALLLRRRVADRD